MLLYKYCSLSGLDIIRNSRIKISAFDQLNDPMELLRDYGRSPDRTSSTNSNLAFLREISRYFGTACFSEECNNPLMWAHYADNHAGIVIGFDADLFTDEIKFTLTQVTYSDHPVKDYMVDDLTDILSWFGTKSTHWSYEKEWRIVSGLQECLLSKRFWKPPVHFLQIPPDSVVQVILGCRFNMMKNLGKVVRACMFGAAHPTTCLAAVEDDKYGIKVTDFIKNYNRPEYLVTPIEPEEPESAD